jgi:hypothetical protein
MFLVILVLIALIAASWIIYNVIRINRENPDYGMTKLLPNGIVKLSDGKLLQCANKDMCPNVLPTNMVDGKPVYKDICLFPDAVYTDGKKKYVCRKQ